MINKLHPLKSVGSTEKILLAKDSLLGSKRILFLWSGCQNKIFALTEAEGGKMCPDGLPNTAAGDEVD